MKNHLKPDEPHDFPAYYPGKENWKAQPGNRYTPEELQKMCNEWDVTLIKPPASDCHSLD